MNVKMHRRVGGEGTVWEDGISFQPAACRLACRWKVQQPHLQATCCNLLFYSRLRAEAEGPDLNTLSITLLYDYIRDHQTQH